MSKIRVLIAEDDFLVVNLTQAMLKQLGYEVVGAARDGQEAVEMVQQLQPDAVLMDINMPHMNGLEAAKQIYEKRPIAIVVLTALQSQELVERGASAGVGAYLTKPVDVETLDRALRIALARHQDLMELRSLHEKMNHLNERLQNSLVDLESAMERANRMTMEAEISNMELEQVFRVLEDPMWIVREGGEVVRANESMLKLLGKSREETLGRNCCDLLCRSLYGDDSCLLQRKVRREGRREFGVDLTGEGGREGHYLVSVAPLVTLDGTDGIVAHFKDITDRRQAEEALTEANRQLERMARKDGLTQVANRRCFDETLEREWRRLGREKGSLSLIMCDVDHFKRFNDAYGHQEGDECLKRVADAIGQALHRPADLVCRYGGEEFAVLLPNTDLSGAMEMAEAIESSIRSLQIPHRDSDVCSCVTLSMGVACQSPAQEEGAAGLVAQADQALYQSKAQGRNRFTCFTPHDSAGHVVEMAG